MFGTFSGFLPTTRCWRAGTECGSQTCWTETQPCFLFWRRLSWTESVWEDTSQDWRVVTWPTTSSSTRWRRRDRAVVADTSTRQLSIIAARKCRRTFLVTFGNSGCGLLDGTMLGSGLGKGFLLHEMKLTQNMNRTLRHFLVESFALLKHSSYSVEIWTCYFMHWSTDATFWWFRRSRLGTTAERSIKWRSCTSQLIVRRDLGTGWDTGTLYYSG